MSQHEGMRITVDNPEGNPFKEPSIVMGESLVGKSTGGDVFVSPESLPNEETGEISIREVIIAEPHGECRGVEAAFEKMDEIFEITQGRKIYSYNEIVHNDVVNERYKQQGLVILPDRTIYGVRDYSNFPIGGIGLITAHGGTPYDTLMILVRQGFPLDLTCPLVDAEHNIVKAETDKGVHVVLLAKDGHPEGRGTEGFAAEGLLTRVETLDQLDSLVMDENTQYAFAAQTTMNILDIERFRQRIIKKRPDVKILNERGHGCYATQDRQEAVVELREQVDAMLIITGRKSNNGENLAVRAEERKGLPVYRIYGPEKPNDPQQQAEELDSWIESQFGPLLEKWFPPGSGRTTVGITSAASQDENDFKKYVNKIASYTGVKVTHQDRTVNEPNKFRLRRADMEALKEWCAQHPL